MGIEQFNIRIYSDSGLTVFSRGDRGSVRFGIVFAPCDACGIHWSCLMAGSISICPPCIERAAAIHNGHNPNAHKGAQPI